MGCWRPARPSVSKIYAAIPHRCFAALRSKGAPLGHHWCVAASASVYSLAQSADCSCIDLHHARCILSTSSAELPFAAGYGLMVSFMTATNVDPLLIIWSQAGVQKPLLKTEVAVRQVFRDRVSLGRARVSAEVRDAGDDTVAPVFHDLLGLVREHLAREP